MRKTSQLTEGAIIAALYTVLLFITIYVPFTSLVTVWVLSVPFTMFTVRNGFKPSLLLFSVTLVLTLIIGGLPTVTVTVLYGSVGIVLGVLYKQRKSSFGILLGGSLVYLTNIILMFVVSAILFDINMVKALNETVQQSINLSEKMSGALGQDTSKQMEQLKQALTILPFILPSIMIMASVVLAAITQTISNVILKRFRIETPKWQPFREWSFPKSFVWYYLGGIVLLMLNPEQGTALYTIGMNLYLVLELAMVIQGLSVIHFFFWKKKQNKAIPILITIFTLLIPILLYVVRIIGIIDLGFNLRKRIKS